MKRNNNNNKERKKEEAQSLEMDWMKPFPLGKRKKRIGEEDDNLEIELKERNGLFFVVGTWQSVVATT